MKHPNGITLMHRVLWTAEPMQTGWYVMLFNVAQAMGPLYVHALTEQANRQRKALEDAQ